MQARGRKAKSPQQPPRPNLYRILAANLDKPIQPENPKSLAVRDQLKKNEKTRLFDDLGSLLDPVFNEFYKVDSASLADILPNLRTAGAQNDYKITDEHSQAQIKFWCKTIMHRARPALLNHNNAILQSHRRNILGKTSEQLSNLDLLTAYFGAFMQHILVRMQDEGMVQPEYTDRFMALQNYISASTPSNSSVWASEVLDEHLHPEKKQTQLPQPKREQQKEQNGLSGGEIAGLVTTGLLVFGALAGGLAFAASKKGREDRPRSNNNNNDSPPPSPYFGRGGF